MRRIKLASKSINANPNADSTVFQGVPLAAVDPPVLGRFVTGAALAVGETAAVGLTGSVGPGVGVGANVSTSGIVSVSPAVTEIVVASSAYGATSRMVSTYEPAGIAKVKSEPGSAATRN